MQDKSKFEVATWNKIRKILLEQAEKIRKENFKVDIIIGIARGGWIPARILSDFLDISDLASMRVEFYLGPSETRKAPILTQGVSSTVSGKNVLLVDDIADTGKSLALAKDHILEKGAADVRILTVYRKPWSDVNPEYFGRETPCWVIFPWETRETLRKIAEKYRDRKAIAQEFSKLVKAGLSKRFADEFLKEIEDAPC